MSSMTTNVVSGAAPTPEPGQLVEVRRRQWIVNDVHASALAAARREGVQAFSQHLVTATSIDEDALGEEIQVVWELEPGARILEKAGLPKVGEFDEPGRVDAFLDAVRWGAATNADVQALQAPFRSGIAIEDYQLDPLVRGLQMPRVNLLIADDVGLGKTIEAGLVAQELLLRHRARTILIVCPASLQLKWQAEMQEKFGLEFRIVDTSYLKDLRRSRGIHANPWSSFPRLITSMDWLKSEIPLRFMRDAIPPQPSYPRTFDLLIVDEAHNVAPSGTGNYALDSLRTQAIRTIAPHFEHRVFLTATPHNGFQESFTSLLELLDDQRFARGVQPDQERLARVMVRRLKTDITDANGNRVFPERRLEALEVDYSDEERRIHASLVEYTELRQAANREAGGSHATEFVLKLLKKRLFSSPAAFASTLDEHRKTLTGRKKRADGSALDQRILRRLIQQTEEEYADDERYEEAQGEAVNAATAALANLSPRERELLEQMAHWAERAKARPDSKAKAILAWLKQHVKPAGSWSNERVIIFTEYRATQKWLIDLLTAEGLGGGDRLMTIYGGMDKDAREAVKAAFQADPNVSPVRILVATDAASEGIDLQNHCRYMIHAEIPWNPNVLEQRNGRIDRHGQKAKEVLIWHPVGAGYRRKQLGADVTAGSLEGDLEFLMVAARKVEAIRTDLGKVGPVIAAQVEQAMLGKRKQLDTARAERDAQAATRELPIERKLRERVARLHAQLVETREVFHLSPANVCAAVQVALDLARLPALEPIDHPHAPKGSVFRMPAFQGTWARCTEGLAHPHTGVRRPITFDHDVARGRDDIVLVHLEHRLVQMCLRLLRAEVWAPDDVKRMHRVTARVAPDEALSSPAVIVMSRLVLTGGNSTRLHEELTAAGGLIQDGRFTRLNVTQTDAILSTSQPMLPGIHVLGALQKTWPKIEAAALAAAEARSSDRMRNLQSTLDRRRTQEMDDITNVLDELARTIRQKLGEADPAQLALWTTEEQGQLRRNADSLRARLAAIPEEIAKERQLIAGRYAEPAARTFPVAVVFVVPQSMVRRVS
ncbi:MAG: DISARM system SNF2-like helicase DrmD [Dehalococcoidia bacterium]|nr:DISARM system SNF2-like helicase DrmD [Dehalococcoidia bacterium]